MTSQQSGLRSGLRPARLFSRAGLALGVALLMGCSVTGTNFSPGVAAQVEDTTISTSEVDDLVTTYCEFVADNPQEGQQPQARFGFRSQLVALLIQREAVAQLVEENDVELASSYDQALAELDRAFADLPADQRETNSFINEAVTYANEGQLAIGTELLAQEGGEPDPEAAQARGAEEMTAWISTHDIDVDPRYGLEPQDGVLAAVDTEVSVPGQGTTTVSVDEQPDPSYVAGLPASQRCG